MHLFDILIPAAVFAGLGIVFGILLAIAAHVFAVKTDERIPKILEQLPGANCGGCGYSGCAALAEAIVDGKATPGACRACSESGRSVIADLMGLPKESYVPMHAHVLCSGDSKTAVRKYRYEGARDCVAAEKLSGGPQVCPNGCVGLGTCVAACRSHAMQIVDGIAKVDLEKCTGCGACVSACPKHLIALVPVSGTYCVSCSSREPGACVRTFCTAGCIACKICEKNCPVGAVRVTDSIAVIDQSKCIGCGVCAEKCPRKIIRKFC